jgi:hypothetical protein
MTTPDQRAQVDELVARRQALRAGGASRETLNANRLALVAAIRRLNRSLAAVHLGSTPLAAQ